MEITQNLVELFNARFQDLVQETVLLNAVEFAEDIGEIDGTEVMNKSLFTYFSKRFNKKVSDSDDVKNALEEVRTKLEVTMQMDYLTKKFTSVGANSDLTDKMKELKEKNLKELMNVLRIDKSEVE